jgi:Ca-activated chloride channel homolog
MGTVIPAASGGAEGPDMPIWMSFERPAWLLLIPLLCFVSWWIARRSLAGGNVSRQMVNLIIRCVVFALLCIALAEPNALRRADEVAVVAVVDVSDSVPGNQQGLVREFLASSLENRPAGDRFGLVTIGRDALVQSLPSNVDPRVDILSTGAGDASDLRQGVDLARSLIPSDAAGRVLLLSDGNETIGSLAGTAAMLRATGVPIDVASVEYDRSVMVRIEDVVVPVWARDGDTITARVILNAERASSGKLTLLINDEPVDLDPDSPGNSSQVTLSQGLQVLAVPLKLPSGPVHRVEAVYEPDDPRTSIPELLRGEGVIFTNDRGRVLVVSDDTRASAALVNSISSEDMKLEVWPASAIPHTLAELSGYDAIVLMNQPASNFSQGQQESIAKYVHDAGGGLLVIGGPESFGAGGWIGSPVEDVLPILLDPPQKRQMPMGALAVVIDRSGSMASAVTGTGMSQQQIANEAAILGVRSLSRLDQITVIAFDGGAETIVPLTPALDLDGIARRIRSIGPGGGTNLLPGLDAAAAELTQSPAGVKHIIVLTDGQTSGNAGALLARASDFKRRGITLSTVIIGDHANDPLLIRMARTAGGRFYHVTSENSQAVLPQIFIKEAQTIRRTLIWEGPRFVPTIAFAGEAMRGLPAEVPGMTGYVVTADRGGLSTVALRGPEGDPLLAQWQHGLGRVTAYTSDASTRWNPEWALWSSFASFWSQQVKWVMRPSGNSNARVTVDTDGERSKVTLDLLDNSGERVNFAAIRARLVPPASDGVNDAEAQDVVFRQIGPGRYETLVNTAELGSHLLSVRYDAWGADGSGGERSSGSVRAAIVRHSNEEFSQTTPNTNLLWDLARQTNGRIYRLESQGADLWDRAHLAMPSISRPIWLLIVLFAVGLFLVDVAARRVTLDPARIQKSIATLIGRTPQIATVSTTTLATAKARAHASMGVNPGKEQVAGYGLRTTVELQPGSPISTLEDLVTSPTDERSLPRVEKVRSAPGDPEASMQPTDEDVMARLRAAKRRSSQSEQDSQGE